MKFTLWQTKYRRKLSFDHHTSKSAMGITDCEFQRKLDSPKS